jgi:hypothetical protein
VLHRYTSTDMRSPAAGTPAPAAAAQAGQAPVHVIVLAPGMLGLPAADDRLWSAGRSCAPALDGPGTSAAHLDNGTFLSR